MVMGGALDNCSGPGNAHSCGDGGRCGDDQMWWFWA